MIYLLKSNDKLKIGYTKNMYNRFMQYKNHNPDIELLYFKDGAESDESILLNKCNKYLVYGNEWFEYNEFIVNEFLNYGDTDLYYYEDMFKYKVIKKKELEELDRIEGLKTPNWPTEGCNDPIIVECMSNIINYKEYTPNELKSVIEPILSNLNIKYTHLSVAKYLTNYNIVNKNIDGKRYRVYKFRF